MQEEVKEEPVRPLMAALYAHFHEALQGEQYPYIDFLLQSFDVKKIRPEMVIGILTITLSWRSELKARAGFFRDAYVHFEYQYPPERLKGLLGGLE